MSKEKQIEETMEDLRYCHTEYVGDYGDTYTDYKKTAEKLVIMGYRKQSEWISVEERLPERIGKYLVCTCDRRVYIGNFIDYYCDGDPQFDNYKVTHWMPLPEAPKMKGENE